MPKKKYAISEKDKFIWNLLGSLSTAVISVIFLIVVSRILNHSQVDTYGFAYALGSLYFVIGLFQVRNYQSTDINGKFSFTIYFTTRLLTNGLMVAATLGYLLVKDYILEKNIIILLMILYRATDALSDVFQGNFQQHERLDLAGKSLFFRNVFITLVFTLSLIITQQLIFSLTTLLICSILCIVYFDVYKTRPFDRIDITLFNWTSSIDLMKECFPLFVNGFLILYIYNQPKYIIDALLEGQIFEAGIQKNFNIIFMPTFVMNMLMLFFRPLITQMAILHQNNQRETFYQLQKRLFIMLLLMGGVVILGSYILGIPFLNILYGVQLEQEHSAFMILMISGLFSCLSTAIDNILTVLRRQGLLVVSYLSAFIVSLVCSPYLVEQYQVFGASLSFLLAIMVWFITSLVIYIITLKTYQKI